jgi:hypothetical protein
VVTVVAAGMEAVVAAGMEAVLTEMRMGIGMRTVCGCEW